jgi:hypothetical protein
MHVPFVPVQAWQLGQEADPQQRPSTQWALAQSLFMRQACPSLLRQLGGVDESQVRVPEQVSASSAPLTSLQVPAAFAHDLH